MAMSSVVTQFTFPPGWINVLFSRILTSICYFFFMKAILLGVTQNLKVIFISLIAKDVGWAAMVHAFNPSIREAEAGKYL